MEYLTTLKRFTEYNILYLVKSDLENQIKYCLRQEDEFELRMDLAEILVLMEKMQKERRK